MSEDLKASVVAAWLEGAPVTPAAGGSVNSAPPLERAKTAEDMFDLAAAPIEVVAARLVPTDGATKPIDIHSSDTVVKLGRAKDLPLTHRLDCNRLSAYHCELRIAPVTNVVCIVDTSTNGVWVNGERLVKGSPVELTAGDTIHLLNPALPPPPGAEGPKVEFIFQQLKPKTTVKTLEDDLTCSVCRCVYYKAVTVIPCMHSFCNPCISQWLGGPTPHQECPECRARVREVRPSHKLRSLGEELVKSKPTLGHPDDEMAALDALCHIPAEGKYINTGKRDRESSDDDDELESDDDGSEDSEPEWTTQQHNLPMFFHPQPTSCPQCATPAASDGFTCPPNGPHLQCFSCETPFPDRPLCGTPQKCDLCNKAFCDLYLGGCRNPGGVGYLQPIREHTITELPSSMFKGNTVEQGILQRYVAMAHIDVAVLWSLCIEKLCSGEWIPDITSVRGPLTDAVLCRPCAQRVFGALLYHFRRAIPRDSLPAEITSRPDCWYGMECRTMLHNLTHAQSYNHVCANVKRKE